MSSKESDLTLAHTLTLDRRGPRGCERIVNAVLNIKLGKEEEHASRKWLKYARWIA